MQELAVRHVMERLVGPLLRLLLDPGAGVLLPLLLQGLRLLASLQLGEHRRGAVGRRGRVVGAAGRRGEGHRRGHRRGEPVRAHLRGARPRGQPAGADGLDPALGDVGQPLEGLAAVLVLLALEPLGAEPTPGVLPDLLRDVFGGPLDLLLGRLLDLVFGFLLRAPSSPWPHPSLSSRSSPRDRGAARRARPRRGRSWLPGGRCCCRPPGRRPRSPRRRRRRSRPG